MGDGYPSDWDSRRKAVYRRDDYQCRNCGRQGGPHGDAELHAHHIVPKSKGGSDELSNLATLCGECHNEAHLHDINDRKNEEDDGLSDHVEELAAELGVSRPEIRKDLENLTSYSVPIPEAKKSVRRKHTPKHKCETEESSNINSGNRSSESEQNESSRKHTGMPHTWPGPEWNSSKALDSNSTSTKTNSSNKGSTQGEKWNFRWEDTKQSSRSSNSGSKTSSSTKIGSSQNTPSETDLDMEMIEAELDRHPNLGVAPWHFKDDLPLKTEGKHQPSSEEISGATISKQSDSNAEPDQESSEEREHNSLLKGIVKVVVGLALLSGALRFITFLFQLAM